MKFGIRFNSDTGTLPEVVELAVLAEEAGFDYIWYCQDLMKRDVWIALTAIAAATKRIGLGTAIVNPFSASPAEIAMAAASLHEFSGGRLVLGIGAGAPEFLRWVNLWPDKPFTGVKEAVAILRRLLSGRAADIDGQVFKGWKKSARLRFPVPGPPIPIYVGAQRPKMLQFAGEAADGALPITFPPEAIDSVVRHIRTGADRAGRSLADFDLAPCVWWSLAEDAGAARMATRQLIAYYGHALGRETLAPIGLSPEDFSGMREAFQAGNIERAMDLITEPMYRLAMCGNATALTERAGWLKDRGATQLNIGPPLGPDLAAAIRLTGQRVIPALR
ncbi:MAG: LLM class flavin-dependent oxidoreductase [Thermaerobacterales bacterium]